MRRLMLLLAGLIATTALGGCAGGGEDATTPEERWTMRVLFFEPTSLSLRINDRAQIISEDRFWEKGKVSELGTLGRNGGWARSVAINRTLGRKDGWARSVAINDGGQVVGHVNYDWSESETHGMSFSTPVVWEEGRAHALGLLSGPPKSWPPPWVEGEWGGEATAINNRGQIVGWSDTRPVGNGVAHAFLWEEGKMRDLGTLGGERSEAVAINDHGQVVGWSETGATGNYEYPIRHAFLWENGKMIDLGEGEAVAINERSQVVGSSSEGHAFLWQRGKMIDLGTLGGERSEAVAINERGQVVGSSEMSAKTDASGFDVTPEHAVVWERDLRPTDLGGLGAAGDWSEAYQINQRGQIVGREHLDTVILWTLRP
jgi:probable HAF family extracellular repeat protein